MSVEAGETVVTIDQESDKSNRAHRPTRGLMPVIRTEYERMCDELGGPADIDIALLSSAGGSKTMQNPSPDAMFTNVYRRWQATQWPGFTCRSGAVSIRHRSTA